MVGAMICTKRVQICAFRALFAHLSAELPNQNGDIPYVGGATHRVVRRQPPGFRQPKRPFLLEIRRSSSSGACELWSQKIVMRATSIFAA